MELAHQNCPSTKQLSEISEVSNGDVQFLLHYAKSISIAL